MKLQRIIMLRMSGDDVKWMQQKLKEFGFYKDRIDGHFGQNTLVSVTNFQRAVGIKADGVVGPQTWSNIINYLDKKPNTVEEKPKNDIPFKISHMGEDGLTIYDCLLEEDEYYSTITQKDTIFLHHTAGGSRPDWTIGSWERDFLKDKSGNPVLDENGNPKPLKVATSYLIGRSSSSKKDTLWDGKILRAFDDRYWAYHLGISKNSKKLNSMSVGIELCNYGPLTQGKDGRFYNYVNKPINDEDVVELDKSFRGYKYYEKYTDVQLESTRKLIIYLQRRWDIEIEKGIYNEDWFEYNDKWFQNGGLRSHTQVRTDKFDIFPQKELIQMLNSL
jgi:N-acetyl-anhydromuramyl-L-alanine amidase AmpD